MQTKIDNLEKAQNSIQYLKIQDAVKYFKENKQGFERLLKKIKNKYQSFDGLTPRKCGVRKTITTRKRCNIRFNEEKLL